MLVLVAMSTACGGADDGPGEASSPPIADSVSSLPGVELREVAVLEDGTVLAFGRSTASELTATGFSEAGAHLWSRTFSASGSLDVRGSGPAGGKEVAFCGIALGTYELTTGKVLGTPGGPSSFVARMDAAGNVSWSAAAGAGVPTGCVGTSDGGAVVVGLDAATVNFNTWYSRVALDGTLAWEKVPIPGGASLATSVTLGAAGTPVLGMQVRGEATLAGATVPSGHDDYVVVANDGSLTLRLQVSRSSMDVSVLQLSNDGAGAVYVGGSVNGVGQLGSSAHDTGLPPSPDPWAFAGKLSGQALEWSRLI